MKRVTLFNCVVSIVSLSCLGLIAFLLVGMIVLQNFGKNTPINSDGGKAPSEYSHLQAEQKPVEAVVALVSDSENDWEALSKVIEALENKVIPNAFHLGDITQLGVIEDLQEAKTITTNETVKFNYVPGDRDLWKSSGVGNFNEVMGQNYSVVTIGSSDFLLIDNSNEFEGIDDEQWKFIEANIANAEYVLLHNPIYFNDSLLGIVHKGMGQYSTEVEEQRVKLLSLIRNSNVKAVFAGDQHLFSESVDSEKPSLNHYVVGSLNTEKNIQQPNYVLLTLYADGDYHVEQLYLMGSPAPQTTN